MTKEMCFSPRSQALPEISVPRFSGWKKPTTWTCLCVSSQTLKHTLGLFIPFPYCYAESYSTSYRLLENASKFIADYNNLRAIHRGAAHSQLGRKLRTLQQELDSFGARFRVSKIDITCCRTHGSLFFRPIVWSILRYSKVQSDGRWIRFTIWRQSYSSFGFTAVRADYSIVWSRNLKSGWDHLRT